MKYHDYHILRYIVDCVSNEITFDIGYPYSPSVPEEKIVFSDVVGYSFQDALGSIILDIQEIDLKYFVETHASKFQKSFHLNGIPKFWKEDVSETMRELSEKKVWKIESSIGFDGYVVASKISQPEPDGGPNPVPLRSTG